MINVTFIGAIDLKLRVRRVKMNIYNLSPEHINEISAKIDLAKSNHIQWLNTFNGHLICEGLAYPHYDHKNCIFSDLYNVIVANELDSEEFIEATKLHKKLHIQARIMANKHHHKQAISVHDYKKFIALEEHFIHILEALHSAIASTKYGIDYLTKMPNRGLLQLILEKEYALFERKGGSNCVALADIDLFKSVNDQYGHLAGDEVLKAISELFISSLRKYDSVGRYGGEEFLFYLPDTDLREASIIFNRLRFEVENLSIKLNEKASIKVTCSFGLSKFVHNKSLEGIIEATDNALYFAKENGRNRVKVS